MSNNINEINRTYNRKTNYSNKRIPKQCKSCNNYLTVERICKYQKLNLHDYRKVEPYGKQCKEKK